MMLINGMILAMLLFAVGWMSVKSNRVVAKVFMFGAIGLVLLVSFAIPPVEEYHGCFAIYSYNTPMAVIVSVVFWLMLIALIATFIWQSVLNRKAVDKGSDKTNGMSEPKADEYYDDLL